MIERNNFVSNYFHKQEIKSKQVIQKETKISNVFVCLVSVGHHTVYRMSAASEDDRKDWIRALRIASQNQLPKQRLS